MACQLCCSGTTTPQAPQHETTNAVSTGDGDVHAGQHRVPHFASKSADRSRPSRADNLRRLSSSPLHYLLCTGSCFTFCLPGRGKRKKTPPKRVHVRETRGVRDSLKKPPDMYLTGSLSSGGGIGGGRGRRLSDVDGGHAGRWRRERRHACIVAALGGVSTVPLSLFLWCAFFCQAARKSTKQRVAWAEGGEDGEGRLTFRKKQPASSTKSRGTVSRQT